MKFCAYMTLCLCLPFALLAEDGDKDESETPSEDDAVAEKAEVDPGFERYKTILDRFPFGQPPPGFNPDAPDGTGEGSRGGAAGEEATEAEVSEMEQQILSSVAVSMLNRSPDGSVFVGFTDKSVQPPRNYLLRVGEKREGCEWMIVDANPEERSVKLSKGGVEATFRLGGSGASEEEKSGDGENKAKNAGRPKLGPLRRLPRMGRHDPAEDAEGAGKLSGLDIARARHQQRREQQQAEEEQQRLAAEQARKERELEKKEREQEKKEREQAAEERKKQLDQLMEIQEELRRQREEKLAERERRAAEEEAAPSTEQQDPNEN